MSDRASAGWLALALWSSGCAAARPSEDAAALGSPGSPQVAAVSAGSAPTPASEPKVIFDLGDRDRLFAFPTSISLDGKLVALLVSPFDFDYDQYVEQRLLVLPVDGGRPTNDMDLSSVYTDGSLEELDRGETARVERVYGARAAEANRLIAGRGLRPLSAECGIDLELSEGKLVARRSGHVATCHDTRVDWTPKLAEPRCRSVNRALVDVAGCDPSTGLVVVRLGMTGGHVGCKAPATTARTLHLPRTCWPDAASPDVNAR